MIIDALLHLFDLVWVGRYLSIPGTILILLSFFYSISSGPWITLFYQDVCRFFRGIAER